MQFLPLLDGGGLVHVLVLVFKQPTLLHSPQFPQTVQPPATSNQSGYEPLNLENGSFVNSDNFDATDFTF